MGNNKSDNKPANKPAQVPTALKIYLEAIKKQMQEKFGANAEAMATTLVNLYQQSAQLQKCSPRSIVGAAALAATTKLSLNPSLGRAYIVPFKGKDGRYQATFQIGFKGLIELAHRTGQYTALHAGKVCDGEIQFNPITGAASVGTRKSDTVIGYVAYMRLKNGFEKTLFMTNAELEEHALKYSQSYKFDKVKNQSTSPWTTNFEAMATKTVMKKLLNTWGILNTEMMQAIMGDQAAVDRETFTYVDNEGTIVERSEAVMAIEAEVQGDSSREID